MNQTHHVTLKILRLKEVQTRSGESRSSIYKKIADGLFCRPIRLGARAVGCPEHEVQAILAARIAGQSNEQIKALVASLNTERSTLSKK